ncbi:hypothetical protein GGI42DRAFT_335504 [Trichoderma sp. SZMC 28013]
MMVLSPDRELLAETDDQYIYTLKKRDTGIVKEVIPADEILNYRVLARCQHLACGPTKKPRSKATRETDIGSKVAPGEILYLTSYSVYYVY